jgi:signal transduction histidine kinase
MRAEEEQELSLNDLMQKIIHLFKPVLRKDRIRLETELDPHLPNLTGSGIRLEQAFLNVMLNAVQHMALKPAGNRILSVTTSWQATDRKRPVQVCFADTGPGIHRQLWEKIFDLGFTTRLGGTGQGLYITRSLIEAGGGQILVKRSVIPLGTTFLVALPLGLHLGRVK